ncbi:MAG: hypothetical protein JNL54_04240 [Kineosporiaceae bacterium]|nr:hypothetical protein [Kineosporiaceae bacterium]
MDLTHPPVGPPAVSFVSVRGMQQLEKWLADVEADAPYSLVFEATSSKAFDHDPMRGADVLGDVLGPPVHLIAVLKPKTEVHLCAQHAIACEVRHIFGGPALLMRNGVTWTLGSIAGKTGRPADRGAVVGDRTTSKTAERLGPVARLHWSAIAQDVAWLTQGQQFCSDTELNEEARRLVSSFLPARRGSSYFRLRPAEKLLLYLLAAGETPTSVASLSRAAKLAERTVRNGLERVAAEFPDVTSDVAASSVARCKDLAGVYAPWLISYSERRPLK